MRQTSSVWFAAISVTCPARREQIVALVLNGGMDVLLLLLHVTGLRRYFLNDRSSIMTALSYGLFDYVELDVYKLLTLCLPRCKCSSRPALVLYKAHAKLVARISYSCIGQVLHVTMSHRLDSQSPVPCQRSSAVGTLIPSILRSGVLRSSRLFKDT